MSYSIPRITSTLISSTILHQTICAAPEVNEIFSLANSVLNNLSLFPSITHIGSVLKVVAFTAWASAALTKLCIGPESIKTVLQYTSYIVMGNSKSCNFFKRFSPNTQEPCKFKHYRNYIFLPTYHCMFTFSIVPSSVFLT